MLQHFPILRSFDSPERSGSKKRPTTTAASETAGSAESHLRLVKKARSGVPHRGEFVCKRPSVQVSPNIDRNNGVLNLQKIHG